MTQEEILALDGPGLTRLAWELGLGGTTREYVGKAGRLLAAPAADGDLLDLWEPHEDLAQADAVFRALRARGWRVRMTGGADDGEYSAEKRLPSRVYLTHRVGWPVEAPTETQALLRCAVLAVASEATACG